MISHSGGIEIVSVAVAGDFMVVSCAPGWDNADWTNALAPYQGLNAHLHAMDEESDGTEIYVFALAEELVA